MCLEGYCRFSILSVICLERSVSQPSSSWNHFLYLLYLFLGLLGLREVVPGGCLERRSVPGGYFSELYIQVKGMLEDRVTRGWAQRLIREYPVNLPTLPFVSTVCFSLSSFSFHCIRRKNIRTAFCYRKEIYYEEYSLVTEFRFSW